jgi:phosphoglucomutase
MMLCEAAAFYKKKGLTLWDQMMNIYREYGFYKETQIAITMPGIEGAGKITALMDGLRKNPPAQLDRWKVMEFRDYETGIVRDIATGKEHPTGLPESNVLYFELDDDAWVCARPSGTEPKIKFYIGVRGKSLEDADKQNKTLSDALRKLIGD